MQWVWEEIAFQGRPLRVAHYEAPGRGLEEVSDEQANCLDRCEAELGACLWHDTNVAALRFFEEHRPRGYAGCRVLELGAGAGVCGLALAVCGADATITDVDALVPLMKLNIAANGFQEGAEEEAAAADAGAAGLSRAARAKARRKGRGAARRRGGGDDSEDGDAAAAEAAAADPEAARRPSARERKAARAAAREAKQQGRVRPAAAEAPAAAQSGEESAGELHEPRAVKGRRGQCVAAAGEWLQEAKEPSLPEGAFDIVIVCDCLYENKESWEALEAILRRVVAPGGEAVLASANLRKPFLEEFSGRLVAAGFTGSPPVASEHAVVAVFSRPGAAQEERDFP